MASGDTLLILTPQASTPPATIYATLDTIAGTTAAPDVVTPVLDFDNTVDEYADWACVMPRHYAGGGITLTIVWSAVPTVNDVSWACQIRREEDDSNQITGDFATAVVASASTTAGTARNLTYKTLAMTDGAQMDSVAVGEAFTLRIYRDISVTTTVIGDAELHKIEVQET